MTVRPIFVHAIRKTGLLLNPAVFKGLKSIEGRKDESDHGIYY